MKLFCLLIFLTQFCISYSQTAEETFRVKKRSAQPANEKQRIFDLKLAPGVDTFCKGIWVDLQPLKPYYDSISLFNLKMKRISDKWTMLQSTTIGDGGHGIVKFFQKQKDGGYKLIYIRNWVISCKALKE